MNRNFVHSISRGRIARDVLRTLLVNGLAPYVVFVVVHEHASSFTALAWSCVPPMLEALWSVVSRRRLDVMAVLVLGGLVLGLVMIAMGGDAQLLLVRESLISAAIGLAFLVSLMLSRPLIFYLARELMVGGDRDRLERWNARSRLDPFRRGMRLITFACGALG
jgi:hypothetical protein